MKTINHLLILSLSLSLISCGGGSKYEESSTDSVSADQNASTYVSSSAAVENKKDSSRKFIRTAELKFKVKSVIKTTYQIEEITSHEGGFVTYTKLESNKNDVSTVPVSADSSLETTTYSVINTMTLRVPNTKLDSTLKEISKFIDYLDYRIIKADDVALQILSNKLTQKRAVKNEERLTSAIDKRGKKLNETTEAEELLLNKQEQADNAKVSNLSLQDQINFSTISLTLYQRETVKRELIVNNKNIEAYEPGFGRKILDALKIGWNILEGIIVFLFQLWGLIVLGVILFVGYKIYRRLTKE